jgi:hypothetical protein
MEAEEVSYYPVIRVSSVLKIFPFPLSADNL